METVDARAHRLARSQRGRVSRRQLRDEAGVAPSTVTTRLRRGTWSEPIPNVIDLGTHPRTWRSDVVEVLLAAGPPHAWASHDTAAHLLDFLDAPRPAHIDVTVPRRRHARAGDHRLHTTRAIGADEVTRVHGLACTSPARTLLDLAGRTPPPVLERYLADQERRHPGTVRRVIDLCDRHRRLPGRRRMLEVVAGLPADVGRLGSPLEVVGAQRLRQLDAPPFVLQYVVRDHVGAAIKRVDVAWPALMTVLELDGAAYHDLLGDREADARARTAMRACGWHVEVARRDDLDAPRFAAFVANLRR